MNNDIRSFMNMVSTALNQDIGPKPTDMTQEAVGDSAECFYNLQDEFAGEETSGAHKILIDELVRYLSGDQLQDFCNDFRRHHMDGIEEAAKPDFADIDGDGDKEESMKKAAEDKEKASESVTESAFLKKVNMLLG